MTILEAAGYILGTGVGLLQKVMPFRIWLVVFASFQLGFQIYHAANNQEVAGAVVLFLAFSFVMIGSIVYSDEPKRSH